MQRESAHRLDILQSALLIQEFARDLDEAAFHLDRLHQDAVIRRIEVIGEATRRISTPFRAAHPEIPWQKMAGMRSRLIHEYDRVDLVEVWKVIQEDIPELVAAVRPLIPPETPDEV
ncbi:MAG: HepT-like ribonuclease domain-containing protein [Anaerolineae bacterium]